MALRRSRKELKRENREMQVISPSATFTRPNDTNAYASGDLVANSTTAGSVTPMTFFVGYGRYFELWRIELTRSDTGVTKANFNLHLFRDSPTVANGDNGAISPSVSNFIGTFAVDVSGSLATTGSGKGVVNQSQPALFSVDNDGLIYGLLSAGAAYTPTANGTFTVTLIGKTYQ